MAARVRTPQSSSNLPVTHAQPKRSPAVVRVKALRDTYPSLDRYTLRQFLCWKPPMVHDWQLSDFREHCLDEGLARLRMPLQVWLGELRALIADDGQLFDAQGDGCFAITPVGRQWLAEHAQRGVGRDRGPS